MRVTRQTLIKIATYFFYEAFAVSCLQTNLYGLNLWNAGGMDK